MKKILGLLLFMKVFSIIYSESKSDNISAEPCDDNIKIASVKIIIDDVMYVWNDRLKKPVLYADDLKTQDTNLKLKPQSILSFTDIKPDKNFRIKALNAEAVQTEMRLINSGLVYSAKVTVVPPRKHHDKRTVIIDVQSGFFYRFGGGDAYAMFGKAALDGNRDLLSFYTGYNKNGITYKNENVCGIPFIMGAGVFWNGPECIVKEDDNNLSFYEIGAFRPMSDLILGMRMKQNMYCNDFTKFAYCFEPFINYKKFLGKKVYMDLEVQGDSDLNSFACCNGALAFHFNPLERLCISTMVSAGITPFCNKNVESNGSYNLYAVKNCYSDNSGLNNLFIRSGYSEEELCTDAYYLQAVEIRFKAFEFVISPCFLCSIIPFVYGEAAFIEKSDEVYDGFGGGVRILFDNPVFAYFTFSYGINHKNQPRFCFSTSAGF